MKKVLFIDTTHEVLPQMLADAGFEVHYKPEWSAQEVLANMHEYMGVVIRSRIPVDKAFMEASPNLRFVARVGAGMENIDLPEAARRGITCLNSPEGNRDAVGEHAMGMLLMLMNNMYRAHTEVCRGVWLREENRGYEIAGRTVGIIGHGNMGGAFARKLSGFDARVLAYDKYKSGFAQGHVEECSLAQLQKEADVVSFHVPLTAETEYMLNDDFVQAMAKPFYLINTARGKVVETAAAVRALKSGKILGAALDVLEYEKKSLEGLAADTNEDLNYLRHAGNVVLTPHIAGWTHESNVKLASFLAQKIINEFGS